MMMPDRTIFVFCDAGIRLKEPPWSFHSQKVQGDLGLCVAFSFCLHLSDIFPSN